MSATLAPPRSITRPPAVRVSPQGEQLLVAASLHRSTAVEHHDLIAVPDGGQPVRHYEATASTGPEPLVDLGLDQGVERRGGFIHDQECGVGGERPGDLEALALAAGPVRPALQDVPPVPARPADDVGVDGRVRSREPWPPR